MRRLLLPLLLVPFALRAQPAGPPVLEGALVMDYAVRLVAPDTQAAGAAGFVLRRAFLAATLRPAPRTTARVRFEVDDRNTPAPRLFDAWLRLDDALGVGHALTLGLLPVAEVGIAEETWGYRALERTLRDRAGSVDSRDLGVGLRGPLGNGLRYAFTFGSGGSFRSMERRAGRLYATVEHAGDGTRVAVSGDAGFRDGRRLGAVNVLAALTPGRLRLGAEAFVEAREAAGRQAAIAAFWAVPLRGPWTLAGHSGLLWEEDVGTALYVVAAAGYRMHDALDVLPGIVAGRPVPGDDLRVTARLTMHARF